MKLKAYAIGITIYAMLLLACGGGSSLISPTPTPTPGKTTPPKYGFSLVPGRGTTTMKVATTHAAGFDFSLTPKVYAQTTSQISMTGTYNGYCLGLPSQEQLSQSTGNADYTLSVYGAGQMVTPTCDGFLNGTTSWTSYWKTDPVQAASFGKGFLVIGDGTLQGLVIAADNGGNGTDSNSGLFKVWVQRQGQLLSTPLQCTLGTSVRCQDGTNTFPVLDGDHIVITGTFHTLDSYHGFFWYLGKV